MAEQPEASANATPEKRFREKLAEAIRLKDYAINANLDVPDDIIQTLNKADIAEGKKVLSHVESVDLSIRELIAITFPYLIREINTEERFREKLAGAIRLKDYAINANLDVPDDIIQTLNKADIAEGKKALSHAESVDLSIRNLTAITFPTTIDTLEITATKRPTRFLAVILCVGVVGLFFAVSAFHGEVKDFPWWPSILAVCLGLLGAVVNVFFHLIGIMKERAVDKEATIETLVRVVLGGILGWLLYFALGLKLSPPLLSTGVEAWKISLLALAPFLAGFSTRLVFGVLNQAVKAVELTIGIQDTSTDLLRRGKSERARKRTSNTSRSTEDHI